MSFHSPWGLLALLGVPLIILLYLLKQRHTDCSISSLYLWQKAVQDLEASTPWQKLKKNMLMFLQIAAVVLIALLLSGPFIKTGKYQDEAVLLVLDTSLGMQSTDIKPSRFEAAKKDMEQLVKSYSPGTKFSIVASGRNPFIVQHMVDDKSKVLQEIRDLCVTDCLADMEGTLALVDSLADENPKMRVYWFGDEENPFSDERIHYYSYDGGGANFAVTALSYRKLEESRGMTVLSRIANFSAEDAVLDISLYIDGSFFDARRARVRAGGSESLYWQGVPGSAASIECRIDTEDSLQKDNFAFCMVYPDKTAKTLLATEGNLFLEKILSLMPNLELYRTTTEDIDERRGFDIYVFDGIMPQRLPDDGHILLFAPLPDEFFPVSGQAEYVAVKPAAHEFFDGLKQDMSFGAMKTVLYDLPDWGSPLMRTEKGVAAFEGYRGKNRLMVFGFDLHETNLPVKPFFPILMTRAIEALAPGNMQSLSSLYAGDPVTLPVDPEAHAVYVTTPGGEKTSVAPPFPAPAFDKTLEMGIYTLEQHVGNEVVKTGFFVNAPSEREFALTGGVMPVWNEGQDTDKGSGIPAGWSLKSLLLWLLLFILLVEWWFYTSGNTV